MATKKRKRKTVALEPSTYVVSVGLVLVFNDGKPSQEQINRICRIMLKRGLPSKVTPDCLEIGKPWKE